MILHYLVRHLETPVIGKMSIPHLIYDFHAFYCIIAAAAGTIVFTDAAITPVMHHRKQGKSSETECCTSYAIFSDSAPIVRENVLNVVCPYFGICIIKRHAMGYRLH